MKMKGIVMKEKEIKKKKRTEDRPPPITAATPSYGDNFYQPVTYPDSRYENTLIARPSDEQVAANREWVQENKL